MNREKSRSPGSRRPSHILIHYDEIALKGKNRPDFERRLRSSVRRALGGLGPIVVRRHYGRLVAELSAEADVEGCLMRLERVYGVTRFTPVVRLPADLESVERALPEILEGLSPRSFAVACRRANKAFPLTSPEVNRRLGAAVVKETGWRVDLSDPELTLHVHIVADAMFVGLVRLRGPGGFPYGSTGRVVGLISGGIDSPVALAQILRRGASPVFVHFHSHPHTSAASQEKARELATRLLPSGHRAPFILVPFAPTQHRIITECPPALRVVLYRRFMLRAAEAIAERTGARATVTGDSLGQVASQTLENLDTINRVAQFPVLRPLIGQHKSAIVAEARRIGTYETSIEPHDDCCSFLMPAHPATRSTPRDAERAEAALDVEAEVRRLVESSAEEILRGGGALSGARTLS